MRMIAFPVRVPKEVKEHFERVLRGYAASHIDIDISTISPAFTFDERGAVNDREGFLDRSLYGVLTDLRLASVLCDGDSIVAMFDYTDSVTLLRHRAAWLGRYDQGILQSIVATSAILFSDD